MFTARADHSLINVVKIECQHFTIMKKGTIPQVIAAYKNDAYRWEIHRAMMDFFDGTDKAEIAEMMKYHPDVEGWFNEWLLYDFRLENRSTILEDFVQRNPLELTDEELDVYRSLLKSEPGLYEVMDVKKKKGLRLRSVSTGHEYDVHEKQGTIGVKPGRLIYGRVGKVGDQYELVGSNGIYLDVRLGEGLRQRFLENSEVVNSKTVYQFMFDKKQSGIDAFGRDTISNFSDDRDIDPATACEQLDHVLKQYGLDKFVNTNTVQSWIQRSNTSKSDFSFLTMLLGLLDFDEVSQEDVSEIINAVVNVYTITPQDALGGISPLQKGEQNKNKPPEIITDQIPLHSHEWVQKAAEAHGLMQAHKFAEASDRFQEAFCILMKERTTSSDIYRLFANAGLAHVLNGERELGEKMIEISLELNPNYDFGIQMKNDLESEKGKSLALQGVSQKLKRAMNDPDHPFNRWNPDKVEGMSMRDIFSLLAEYGISESEETFLDRLNEVPSQDDLINEWYKRFTGDQRDEDFVIHAVMALSDRLCPDRLTADALEDVMETFADQVFEEFGFDEIQQTLTRIIAFQHAPVQVLEYWKEHYSASARDFISGCVEALQNSQLEEQVRETAFVLERVLQEPIFSLVRIVGDLFHESSEAWRDWLKTYVKQRPFDYSPFLFLATAIGLLGKIDQEESLLLDALEVVRRREDDGVLDSIEPFGNTLVQAYFNVLEALIDFYSEADEEQAEPYIRQLQSITSRDEISTQAERDQMSRLQSFQEEWLEKKLQEDAGYQYYCFLKPFEIHFATKTLTTSKRSIISLDGSKIGRNDPCPCNARNEDGTPVKYKKCCGK